MARVGQADRKAIAAVAEVLAEIGTPEEMERFLCELLTPAELRDITLRWRLLERLSEGVAQRRIAEELGISLCKITRGSRIMKGRDSVAGRLIGERRARGEQSGKAVAG